MIKIFSDGACSGNPGPGAYATLITHEDGSEDVLSGFDPQTTNNRMEMMGAIAGLEFFKNPIECLLVTDSQYVSKGVTEWLPGWIKNKWRSKVSKSPIKNVDLWKRLHVLVNHHTVEMLWVRGHDGHPENERCDEIARNLIKENTSH
jgi:ribonuclease HI